MGRKFGTLGAMRRRPDGTEVKVEVTTYRSDVYDPGFAQAGGELRRFARRRSLPP